MGNVARGSNQRSGHVFSQVPKAEIQRSTFDRSHSHKTSFNAGFLVPLYVDEVLPGDTFSLSMTGFCRLATPIFPLMDNMYFDTFFFYVPIRLLWANWQKFNGEQTNPGDSTSFVVPQVTFGNADIVAGKLANYMGILRSANAVVPQPVNSLHFRAYNLIYNQWFRDENMINSVVIRTTDGGDLPADFNLMRRGKRHDYFTSCLPWPQKGTAVSIPLGSTATVRTQVADLVTGVQEAMHIRTADASSMVADKALSTNTGGAVGKIAQSTTVTSGAYVGVYPANLYADLSTATAATINSLRQSFQIQKLLERDARGGTRYTEIVKAHFGVTSPDARLQRPEYLGGGSSPVYIAPVAQTGPTVAGQTPQGNLAGFGTVVALNHGFSKSFTEHGVLIGIGCVRGDLTYQQGVNRMWKRQSRYDFYWPALSHIGEQAVLQGEIFADGSAVNEAVVFGYQERYAEMRYKPSLVTGILNSVETTPLDAWHIAQSFGAAPTLNQAFIEENPPMTRVKAVTTQPDFIGDFFFRLRCARPMPVYGVPGLIDHF